MATKPEIKVLYEEGETGIKNFVDIAKEIKELAEKQGKKIEPLQILKGMQSELEHELQQVKELSSQLKEGGPQSPKSRMP